MKQEVIKQELERLAGLARFYGASDPKDDRLCRQIYSGFELLVAQTPQNRHQWRVLLEILWPQIALSRPDLIMPTLFPTFAMVLGDEEEPFGRLVAQVKLDLLPIAA